MSLPEVQDLRRDILREEQQLTMLGKTVGRDSDEYKRALKKFARMWYVLKMARRQDEFFEEVVADSKATVVAH